MKFNNFAHFHFSGVKMLTPTSTLPGVNVIKLFYDRDLRMFVISFFPSKPFQSSQMFASKGAV